MEDLMASILAAQNEAFGPSSQGSGGGSGGASGGGGKRKPTDPDQLLMDALVSDLDNPQQESQLTLSEQLFRNEDSEREMLFGQQSLPETDQDRFRKGRSLSMLDDDSLNRLADDRLFPDALQQTKSVPGMTNEERFNQIASSEGRRQLLRELRDFQIQENRRQQSIDDFMLSDTTAKVGVGLAAPVAAVAAVKLLAATAVKSGAAGIANFLATRGVGTALTAKDLAVSSPTSVKAGAAAYLGKKLYDNMGGDPEKIEQLSESEVQEIFEETMEEEKKLNPDLFRSHGFDVSLEDYQQPPGEMEMTPEMQARDRAELLYKFPSLGARPEDIKRIASDPVAFDGFMKRAERRNRK